MPRPLDSCSRCHGAKGGVPGNENRMEDGTLLCDYCHAEDLLADFRSERGDDGLEGVRRDLLGRHRKFR